MQHDEQEWRPVVGYEGRYEITRCGRIRRVNNGSRSKELRPFYTPSGYLDINLYKNGKMRGRRLHRLLLEAFVGPCPDGMEARHLNGVRDDCRLENLAWGTREENVQDRLLHGNIPRGERHWNSKLSESDVRAIKGAPPCKGLVTQLAHSFGVSAASISRIRHGRIWRWVEAVEEAA